MKKMIVIVIFLIITIGVLPTFNIVMDFLIIVNDAIYDALDESLLSFLFKHKITYYLVGLILSGVFSILGFKLGKSVGKILYAIVLVGVAGMLNYIMILLNLII